MGSLRESRFRRRTSLGEDVNPSAYIVNLADCMLVLACGFLVALMMYWNIDLSPYEELSPEDMEQVDSEDLHDDLMVGEGGSRYQDVGKVVRDPATGTLYIVEVDESAVQGDETAGGEPDGAGATSDEADGEPGAQTGEGSPDAGAKPTQQGA